MEVNMVYMVAYFAFGALGSAMGTFGWNDWKWRGVAIHQTIAVCGSAGDDNAE